MNTCYPAEQLREYILGQLPQATSDQIATHISECQQCEETIVGLDEHQDTLIALIRNMSLAETAETPTSETRFVTVHGFRIDVAYF